MQTMINDWLATLSGVMSANIWLAPLLALLAGVLTAFTPCSLSSVPLVIGYVGGAGQKNTKRAFALSVTFAAGMSVTFTALGVTASLLGKFLQSAGKWWYLLLGVLMVLMALQTWEIFNFIPSTNALSKNKKKGFIGALLAGVLGGLFASPCSTPVLVVLLAFVAKEGRVLLGIFLLLLYSLGNSTLVLVAGTSVGFVKKLSASEKYGIVSKALNIIMGTLILLIAFYMFYLGF